MPTREAKQKTVTELAEVLKARPAVVLTDFRGLDVASLTELRRRLREAGVRYRVVKNTLLARACQEAQVEGLDRFLEGPTAVALSEDPVLPARVLVQFARENKALQLKGGLIEGRVMEAGAIQALAELPPREVLLARVAGGIRGPLAGLVYVLQAPISKLAATLDALRKQREAEQAA